MRRFLHIAAIGLLALGTIACESRTDESDSGLILSISDFNGLPVRVSVNAAGGLVQVESLTLQAIVANANRGSTDLQTIELDSYRVGYRRVDSGTRVPPVLVQGVFGNLAAGGTTDFQNLVLMGAAQMTNPPAADLLFQNGGFDKETGLDIITLELELQFFGHTVSGDAIASRAERFTLELVP